MSQRFQDVITTETELREILGEPSERAANKVIDHLDGHCREFIAASPFLCIASSDGEGHLDISPKGDPPGFVHVLDDHTLVIPDRLGNRRADTFKNLLRHPYVSLIFLVPGKKETLRIAGKATLVRDLDLRQRLAHQNKIPDLALAVHVREAFFHCAKCMVRSHLWQPDHWTATDGLASLAQTMVDGGKLEISVEEMAEIIERDERERLY